MRKQYRWRSLRQGCCYILLLCCVAGSAVVSKAQSPPQCTMPGQNIGGETLIEKKGAVRWRYVGSGRAGTSYTAYVLNGQNTQLKFHIDPDRQRITFNHQEKYVPALQYMGQSWSIPSLVNIRWQGQYKQVMVVGGGYDATGLVPCAEPRLNHQGYECPNYDPEIAKGAGIYMFDADNGELLWWASAHASQTQGAKQATWHSDVKYSVVSQVNSIDRDGDGLADALYFADLGGQVFRVDFNPSASGSTVLVKRVVRLFNAHREQGLSPRFYQMPNFSLYTKQGDPNRYAVIAVSSGNLSALWAVGATLSAQDGIFVLYDQDVARSDLYNTVQLNTVDIAMSQLSSYPRLVMQEPYPYSVDTKGWWYPYTIDSNDAGKYKSLGEMRVWDHVLYNNVYHQTTQTSTLQDCLSPTQSGVTYLYQLCLPHGRCTESIQSDSDVKKLRLGDGIMQFNNTFDLLNFPESPKTRISLKARPDYCQNQSNSKRLECLQFDIGHTLQRLRWLEHWEE